MKLYSRLLIGASTLATSLVPLGTVHAQDASPVVVDGTGSAGVIVHGGTSDSRGNAAQTTIFTNYYTEGGAGSGGGAGLGGVFFVDDGAALTLRNVQFISNTVKGGEGGSVATISLSNIALNLPTIEVDAAAITAVGVIPTLAYRDGQLVMTGATMAGGNALIGAGATVDFGTAAKSGTIASVNGANVSFADSIAIDPSAINAVALSTQAYPGGAPAAGTTTLTLAGDLEAAKVRIGMIVVGNGLAEGTTITEVMRDASNMVTGIKLSTGATSAVSDVKIIALTQFDASRFQVTGANTIKPVGTLAGLNEGMAVTGDGFPAGTTITSIAADGTITFSNAVTPGSSFKAGTQGATVGSSTINLSAARGDLAVGMEVSGTGIADGTRIIAIDGTKITLSSAVSSDAAQAIKDNTFVASFGKVIASSGNRLTLASVDGLKVGALLAGGGVPDNAVITAINSATRTVSYRIDPGAANLANGGSMNGLLTGSAGYNGGNGRGGSTFDALLSDGEGRGGTNGYDGGAGSGGVGGKGGRGGNGSSGMPFNTGLSLAVTSSTLAAIGSTAEAVASWADWSFAMAVLKTASTVTDWATVAVDAASLGKWIYDLNNGVVGLGGEGGAGGDGGDGSTFYGGGAGGDGGNGGDGAKSYTDGGQGGDGGAGGAGGFGAGGGAGGSGGSSGSTGAAKDGGAGDGGSAGFGGGIGSDGDGANGGGGSGFGGAIFVRSGGTLVIAGNALFQNNASLAGSSNNGGSAGHATGSDLFMMKGSTVTLTPGIGNTIRFEGTIADDSSASYAGASYASGAGAGLQITGGGLVQLLGPNTYTGTTYVGGGTLQAVDGVGINANSHLTFNGAGTIGSLSTENAGVWLAGGTVVRRVGGLSHQLNWDGSGGFAAADAKGLLLNFGSLNGAPGQNLTWGQGGFVNDGSTLIFGSEYAQGAVTLANAVNLNGRTGRLAVFDNQAVTVDHAVLAGAFTNGGLIVGDTLYGGTAYFTAQNSLQSLTINNGLVSTRFGESTGRLMQASGGSLSMTGGRLELHGAERLSWAELGKDARLAAFGTVQGNRLNNYGTAAFHADADFIDIYTGQDSATAFYGRLDNRWMVNDGDLLLAKGAQGGYLYNGNDAALMSLGDITNDVYTHNIGLLALGGNLSTPHLYQHGRLAILGDMVDGVETAATRTITTVGLSGTSDAAINLGGLSGAIANTLRLDLAAGEFAGVIDGAGRLVKTGEGKLLLSNANTFTGGLTIEQGGIETTLSGTLADTLAIDVREPGTFIWGSEDAVASLKNGGITRILAFASLEEVANSGLLDLNAPMSVSGTLANANAGTVNIAQTAGARLGQLDNAGKLVNAGDLLVLGAAGNGGMLSLAAGSANRFGSLANTGTITSDASVVVANAFDQSAGSLDSSADLAVGGDYRQTAGEVALGTTLKVGGALALNDASLTTGEDVSVLGDFTAGSAEFASLANLVVGGDYSQTGGTADIGGDAVVQSGITMDNAVLKAGRVIAAGGDYAQTGGTATAGADFGVGGDLRLEDGLLAVAGNAAVTGDYTQTRGTVSAGGLIEVNGAYAQVGGDAEIGQSLLVRSGLRVNGGTLAAGGAIVAGGDYAQVGGITVAGADFGTGGNLRLDGGTLAVAGDAVATGSYAQTLGSMIVGGVLKVGGTYAQTGGVTDVAGDVTVAGGLAAADGDLAARAALVLGGDYAQARGTVTVGTDLGVGGSLQQVGGTLAIARDAVVRGNHAQTGGAATTGGALDVGGTLTLASADLTVGETLRTGSFAQAGGSTTIGGALGVNGSLALAGGAVRSGSDVVVTSGYRQDAGTLNAAGNLLVGGALTLNGGTIAVAGDIASGALSGTGGSIVLAQGAAMAIDQTADGIFAGNITGGTASVIKTGAATLTLAGAAGSFAPAQLFVTAGTVAVDGAGILDSALKVDIADNAGLTLVNGSQTINNLSGFGTLALNGNNLLLANGGDFYGTVTGTGSVSLTSGAFGLSNSVDVQDGSFQVEQGSALSVRQGGTLNATRVQVTGSLDVVGTVTSDTTTVDGGILHLGSGSSGGMMASKALQVTNGGRLTGNGQVAGLTTVGATSTGMLSPGNSPGIMSFADLTLGGQSTALMEVEGTNGAGNADGHDLIAVTGTLTLQGGSTLAIASSSGFEPALGQTVRILDVAPGAVMGQFGTVTSAFDNAVGLNLSTGTLVGLGNAGGNGFIDAAATNANQRAMLSQLRVGTTGGVDQYRGGRLVEQVAGVLAARDAVALAATFDRASPESYAGLADHQRLSVLNGLADLGGYTHLADRAIYATGSIAYDKARSRDEAGFTRFRSRDTRFTVGFAAELALAKLQVSYTHSDGEVTSRTLQGDARGDIFAAGISAPLALDGAFRVMARVSHGTYRYDGDRVTNGGSASFDGVDGNATVYGGGFEYVTGSPRASLAASAEVLGVTSRVDGFAEGGALPFDALKVARQRDTSGVLRARITGGYRLAPNWQAFVKLGLDQDLSDKLLGVTASVISEDAPFTVANPGFTDTRAHFGAGTAVDITPGLRWSVEGDIGNASRVGARTSVTLRF